MQAIILAAGMGKRLKELTSNNTKCMVKVNGVTLIERMLHQLERKNLSRIIIVVGYEGKKLIEYVETLKISTSIIFINNSIYDKTNNIYSLSLAKDYLKQDDTLLFESDIIFEESVLDCLVEDTRGTLALVDKYEPWMDGTCLKLDEDDKIIDFISGRKFDFNNTKDCFKTVNIYKFSKHFSETKYIPFLNAYLTAVGENEYYEQVLRVITLLDDVEIKGKRLSNQKWYEIDDAQDLDIAETIFCSSIDEKVTKMEERYGGYWRFTNLLDFCYLVNPFYPPQKMKDEMRASFDKLLTEYPSGMRVNSLLAAKIFGVKADNIVVGNGAAELIKSLLSIFDGNIGFIKPTFEEYPNRYNKDRSVIYRIDNSDYKYTSDDVKGFFADKDINALICINPDNPSGNYIMRNGLISLIEWCTERNIKIVIDESFADFADEKNNTLINQELLDKYPKLYVMKSISKSYGVPGLRLGVLASGDVNTVNMIKNDVSIWNINSFAEFYMQISEKYKKQYSDGLMKFKDERSRFENELSTIERLRVIPSQANYFMIELLNNKVGDVTKQLLAKYNLLVKDLSNKLDGKDYMRVAIRNKEDNDKLVKALREIMTSD